MKKCSEKAHLENHFPLVEILQEIRSAVVPVGHPLDGDGEGEAGTLGVLAQHVQRGRARLDAVEVAGDELKGVLLGVGGGVDLCKDADQLTVLAKAKV